MYKCHLCHMIAKMEKITQFATVSASACLFTKATHIALLSIEGLELLMHYY